MPKSICDYLGIDSAELEKRRAYNGFVDVDTELFIDPRLLKTTQVPELQHSYGRIHKRFSNIIKLIELSQRRRDALWKRAFNLLGFPEVRGLCIGYSSKSTRGRGIGKKLQAQLMDTAKTIIDAGITDPEIFELVGLFEENVGADLIGDMIGNIIMIDLLAYSHRVFGEIDIPAGHPKILFNKKYILPKNLHNNHPIILVPRDVLNDLPVAHTYEDIDRVVSFNDKLRRDLNRMIARIWGNNPPTKRVYKEAILSNPQILGDLIEVYRNMRPSPYDLMEDPGGHYIWYERTKQLVRDNPMDLSIGPNPSIGEIFKVAMSICKKFKHLIENGGLHTLLYRDRACQERKHEESAQKIFYGVATAYCEANDLDLSPETNSGRGSVDFKLSKGFSKRVLVETKLSSNKNLERGYLAQLAEYQKAEQSEYSIFLVIDVGGCSQDRWNRFRKTVRDSRRSGRRMPRVVYVNGRKPPPASKLAIS